jgi:hypothetical protein
MPPPSPPSPAPTPPPSPPSSGFAAAKPLPPGPKLFAPEVVEKSTEEPPLVDEKAEKTQSASPPPVPPSPASPEKKAKSSVPAGIFNFSQAVAGVFAGQRPMIDDGLDWLAENNYKTVVHLRAPGEADGPDRKLIEERFRMKYISFDVSPEMLSKARVEDFVRLVREVARQPMFVYDQDGALAGPMWYLYFRTAESLSEDEARIRANGLGLREDREGAHRAMWMAAQKYLDANP